MFLPIRILNNNDFLPSLFSGNKEIDYWLTRHFNHAITNKTAVFYGIENEKPQKIVGLYSISSHSIQRSSLSPSRIRRNKPSTIPAILLGILAVHHDYQRQHIGASLLHHAIETAYSASQIIGARFLIVDPIDSQVAQFYQKYGFEPLSQQSQRLYIPL